MLFLPKYVAQKSFSVKMLTDLISQIGLACCSMEPHFFTEELQSLPCKAI